MRKISLLICAIAAIFVSCSKEKEQSSADVKGLVLRINSVSPASRSVGDPGSNVPGTIQLVDGLIFLSTPGGSISKKVRLEVANATSAAGQDLGPVPSNSLVLVVGNMGTSRAALDNCATMDEVLAVAAAIETQADYKQVALSSVAAQAIGVPDANGRVRMEATISPTISRLEMMQVKSLTQEEELAKAKADAAAAGEPEPATAAYVTGYKVAGVYMDRYYPQFTFGGANKGTHHTQGISTDFTGVMSFMKDIIGWSAAGTPPIANPGADKVWAYNLASGGLVPRPIIKLTDITYMDPAGAAQTITEPRYLTIGSYKVGSTPIDAFVRGRIYRVGGTNGISFSIGDMSTNPNPDTEDLYLHVGVEIQEWIIETPDGELQ